MPYSDNMLDHSGDTFHPTNHAQVTQSAGARQRFIWGATAGMLRNFYRFLSA